MPSPRGFSLLMTASQAAARLGVPIETVLGWAAAGQLRIAGQDEDGRALFREAAIDSRGEELATAPLPGPCLKKKAREQPQDDQPLLCGCDLPGLCRTGAAINAALQLAEVIAIVVPTEPISRKLVSICREALTKHLGARAGITGPDDQHPSASGGHPCDTEGTDAEEIAGAMPRLTETTGNTRTEMTVI